jgi:hypothetical protein
MQEEPSRPPRASQEILQELLRETDPDKIRRLKKELQEAYEREQGKIGGPDKVTSLPTPKSQNEKLWKFDKQKQKRGSQVISP